MERKKGENTRGKGEEHMEWEESGDKGAKRKREGKTKEERKGKEQMREEESGGERVKRKEKEERKTWELEEDGSDECEKRST